MEGKRKRGRPRMMSLDWMTKDDYSKLKERAEHRGEWHHWTYEPALEGREPRRSSNYYLTTLQNNYKTL